MSTILDNTHAYELTIGGTAYEAAVKGQILVTQPEAGEIGTMRFQLQAQGSALGVSAWQEAVLEIDAAAYFGGYVVSVTPAIDQDQPDGWETYDVLVEEYATILDRTPVLRRRYSGMTPGAIVADLFDYALDPTGSPPNQTEFDTSTYVSAGSVISGATFLVDNETISEAMDRLALLCNFVWWIDGDKKVHFHSVGTVSAPFAIATVAAANYSTTFPPLSRPTVQRDGSDIRNRVTVYGGVEVIKHQETIEAEGTELLFQLAHFPVVDMVMITVDGVLQSWGTDWYHSFDDYDVLIDYHCGTIRWNTGNEPVGDISVAYYYGSEIKVTVYNTEIPTSATVYGRWFDYEIVDRSITKAATAQALAQAMVNEYEWAAIEGRLQVERLGIKPGEELTIVLPALGLSGSYPVRRVVTEISRAGIARCEIAFGGRRSGLGTQLEGTRQAGPLARSTRWQDRLLTASLQPQWVKAQSTLMLSIGQSSTDQLVANTNNLGGQATAYQWPVYDKAGALAGYVPLYGSAWSGSNEFLLTTGATTGATSQAQTFTNGIIGPSWKPSADSTTALQLQNAAGTPIVTLDTTNLLAYVTGAVSTAPLGSELIVNGDFASNDFAGWTAGANWSAATGAAVHTAGAVETITQSVSVTSGTKYQIVFTTAGRTAGSITIALGAVTLDIGSGATAITTNSTKTLSITAGATGSVAFTVTPTSDWDGAIDSISLKAIGAAQSALSLKDDAGNVFIEFRGKQSLYNTAAGFQALFSNTTGSYNTAAGLQALFSNTTGVYNTAAGFQALFSNTTGVNNTAAGFQALLSNTTGSYNTAAGLQALFSNTTGSYNTAAGTYALFSNTTGSYNTAAGTYALSSNTTGVYNTAAGFQALRFNTTGSYNTAAGFQALFSNTTGSHNTAAGMYALYSNTTGSRNTAAGFQAGRYHASGSTALTDPENSIYIGYDARGKDNDDNNSIVIGYQAIGLGANTTVIGNTSTTAATIYGAGAFPLLSAVTNVVSNVLTLTHDTSGTAAAGFGAGLLYQLESGTTAAQSAARIQALWYEATHATRKADLVLTAYDTAEREGLRIRGAGSAPAIGFLGATPAARRSHVPDASGGSTEDAEARKVISEILITLETFGLHATS